ncbi:MAG: tetratricopeptide (TPR) repeat protein [Gammaproteobacteria bacterium]|jgi:tetratricopeptide (TPR) repeat protein
MKFFSQFFSRRRIRTARRALARNASPERFIALASEYALLGMSQEALDVCREGLNVTPSSFILKGELERYRSEARVARLAQIKIELAEGPRPALWREACEIYIAAGDLAKAEALTLQWHAKGACIGSLRTLAKISLARYFADRGRDQGRQAVVAIDAVMNTDPRDVEGLRLRLKLCTRLGAWDDARKAVQELLEQLPGDPLLEARFRSLQAMGVCDVKIDRAMLEVESTGFFADESNGSPDQGADIDVRPVLRDIARRPEVQAAMYLKGSTMLVQGPRGATAERHARVVKSVLGCSRTTGRRLGLGQIVQVQLEGDFGTLAISPGEMDAGALWVTGRISSSLLATLGGITSGTLSDSQEVAA